MCLWRGRRVCDWFVVWVGYYWFSSRVQLEFTISPTPLTFCKSVCLFPADVSVRVYAACVCKCVCVCVHCLLTPRSVMSVFVCTFNVTYNCVSVCVHVCVFTVCVADAQRVYSVFLLPIQNLLCNYSSHHDTTGAKIFTFTLQTTMY